MLCRLRKRRPAGGPLLLELDCWPSANQAEKARRAESSLYASPSVCLQTHVNCLLLLKCSSTHVNLVTHIYEYECIHESERLGMQHGDAHPTSVIHTSSHMRHATYRCGKEPAVPRSDIIYASMCRQPMLIVLELHAQALPPIHDPTAIIIPAWPAWASTGDWSAPIVLPRRHVWLHTT